MSELSQQDLDLVRRIPALESGVSALTEAVKSLSTKLDVLSKETRPGLVAYAPVLAVILTIGTLSLAPVFWLATQNFSALKAIQENRYTRADGERDIAGMDETLQREMRLLDNTVQREMRLLDEQTIIRLDATIEKVRDMDARSHQHIVDAGATNASQDARLMDLERRMLTAEERLHSHQSDGHNGQGGPNHP